MIVVQIYFVYLDPVEIQASFVRRYSNIGIT